MIQFTDDYQSSNQPQSVYNEYRKLVCSLCNDVMSSSDSSWRDLCYVEDLTNVLLLFDNSQKRELSVDALFGGENLFDGQTSSDEQQCESPKSMKSVQSANSTYTFLSSPKSFGSISNSTLGSTSTFLSSPVENSSPTSNRTPCCSICDIFFSQTPDLKQHMITVHTAYMVLCIHPGCDKEFTCAENVFQHCRDDHGRTSPLESSPLNSDTNLFCKVCNWSPHTESSQGQRSNLTRHMRTRHTSFKVPCPHTGCEEEFTRTDNMSRHHQKRHGVLYFRTSRKKDC